MRYIFVGDIHGNYKKIYKIAHKNRDAKVIQVGDFGVGFGKDKPPFMPENVRFIRGNHDNPTVCKLSPNFIVDGHHEVSENGIKMMFVGGADSIDKMYRTEGLNWWRDEQIDHVEFENILEIYKNFKPDIMISHDGPYTALQRMFIDGTHKPLYPNITTHYLDKMFHHHQPKHWKFGHWHESKTMLIEGTNFQCIDIDKHVEMNL